LQELYAGPGQKKLQLARYVASTLHNKGVHLSEYDQHAEAFVAHELEASILDLWRNKSDDPDILHAYAEALESMGLTRRHQGQLEEAISYLEKANDVFKKLVTENKGVRTYRIDLANNYAGIGHTWKKANQKNKAVGYLRHAIKLLESLGRNEEWTAGEARNYALALKGLADLYHLGNLEEQKLLLEKALPIFRRGHQEEPASLHSVVNLAGCLNDLADVLTRLDQPKLALALAEEAHNSAKQEQFIGKQEIRRLLGPILANLTIIHGKLGQVDQVLVYAHAYAEVFPDNPNNAFFAACKTARCIRSLEEQHPNPNGTQKKQTHGIASDSVRLLHRALDKGYTNYKLVRTHSDLEPLRRFQEYQELCKSLPPGYEELLKDTRYTSTERQLEGMLADKDRERVHEWPMRAGRIYVIEMTTDLPHKKLDPLLRLEDANKKKLAEDDDIIEGKNYNARILFAPKADGVYRLIATSFEQRGVGAYALVIREFAPVKNGSDTKKAGGGKVLEKQH